MEPLNIYKGIQPLVQQDIKMGFEELMDKKLAQDQYKTSYTQAHTHNGFDSVQLPFSNLVDASNYRVVQTITLTPTQIKALFTTPIVLIPSPVTGRTAAQAKILIIVEGIAAYLNYAGTAYVGVNNLEFRYTNASGTKVTTDMASAFLDSAANAYDYAPPVATEFTPVANAPIVVTVPVANPTTGNSPITFVLIYRLIAFQ